MENNLDNSSDTETNNSEKIETSKNSKKWLMITLAIFVPAIIATCFFFLGTFNKDENVGTEVYRFVNNNSTLCTHNFQQFQIDCVNVDTNQKQTIDIPNKYKNLTSIQPSHDGTKLLLSIDSGSGNTRYVVTDTNFTNPLDVTVPYDLEGDASLYPEIIWGSSSDKLLISRQVREENDADFLPAPLVVWEYKISTKENRRIYKNGDNEEPTIKIVGASNEYLFITQPIHKNWVAQDTDPPADALLAVRLDDGFVRVINIEQIVKNNSQNKYASGVSIKYDPVLATFYISGQNQTSETDFVNFYVAANLVDSNGLKLNELSRLSGQEQFYGITSTKGTLLADWSNESEGFKYKLVVSPEETNDLQNVSPEKDNTKFTVASFPIAE